MSFVRCLALLVSSAGCGYVPFVPGSSFGSPTIYIEAVETPGISVDAAAEVEAALGSAFARQPGWVLSSEDHARYRLQIRLTRAATRLAPLTEPAVRAAHYETEIRIQAVVHDRDGAVLWRGHESARADYLSTPGRIEALEGADRRALARAASMAAERLVDAVTSALVGPDLKDAPARAF